MTSATEFQSPASAVEPDAQDAFEQEQMKWERKAFRNATLGKADRAAEALSMLANKNPRNSKGHTPLWVAVLGKHEETVKALAAAGADPDRSAHRRLTPLASAILSGDEKMVRTLLDAGADPSLRVGLDGMLDLAVRERHAGIVAELLGRGVRAFNQNGWVATSEKIAAMLLEAGVPTPTKRETLDSLLVCAVWSGSPAKVRMVLSFGANPNGRVFDGSTPLHAAMKALVPGETGVLRILLEAGADPRILDSGGYYPMDHVVDADDTEEVLLDLLSKKWFDPKWPHVKQGSLLFAASEFSPALVKALLGRGLDPNHEGKNGWRPLLTAASAESKKSLACMDLLLAAGADPTAKDWYGRSAAEFCRKDQGKLGLLEREAIHAHAKAAAPAASRAAVRL